MQRENSGQKSNSFSFEVNYINQNNGFSFDDFQRSKVVLSRAFDRLSLDLSKIKLFDICNDFSSAERAKQVAETIKAKYKKLIIYGIGGSSLGGQAVCGTKFYQLLNTPQTEIIFIDNIHYHNFDIFLQELSFQDTAFLVISKSGSTIETISQILVTMSFFEQEIKAHGSDNFFFITEDTDNPLHRIATSLNCPIIHHHPDIGGRYSCFTEVAMIPAYLVGIDLKKYVTGGKKIIDDFLNKKENSLIFKSAEILLTAMNRGYNNHVIMPYLQRLYQMVYWYAQILAESLGKNSKGMTPIKAMGSVDQHSQLQLYLDGPKDKFFTFITQDTRGFGNKIFVPEIVREKLSYLHGNNLGDVINANQNATIASLVEKNCPVREIKLSHFDDQSLGEILMLLMIETILIGYALEINPFDQPDVEIGKNKARKALAETSSQI